MKKIFSLVLFFSGTAANAGLLIEPYAGYNATAIEYEISGAEVGTGTKGLIYGARLGWIFFDTFFIAADYSTGEMEWDPENNLPKIEGSLNRMGVSAGISLPIAPVRAWLGYYESDFDPSIAGTEFKFEDGEGIKLGVGLTFLPIVDLNLEYFKGEYETYTLNGVEQNRKAVDRGLVISLSAPFDL